MTRQETHPFGWRRIHWPVPAVVLLLSSAAQGMYDPHHGRWFQRDPLGVRPDGPRAGIQPQTQYNDGTNLYGYVRCRPAKGFDPQGMWDKEHYTWTERIAKEIGLGEDCAAALAQANMDTDTGSTGPFLADTRYHWDADRVTGLYKPGARNEARAIESARVREGILLKDCCMVITGIGRLLHIDQDEFSHQAGGGPATDGSGPHDAETPGQHIGLIAGTLIPNLLNPNLGNPTRPDSVALFPMDADIAQAVTLTMLEYYAPLLTSPPCCCPNMCQCSR